MDEVVSISAARAGFTELVARAEAGETTVITRKGERVAAFVPIELLDAAEDAADELLAREACEHLNDPTVTMAELLTDLFDCNEPRSDADDTGRDTPATAL
ncbi:type II toxin-antitoxin system Phd/YefM family antitoxin [Kitasatospora sp. NPDC056446]|uniref:type II toxin-antitoxin system Phd/YefM family antitoxin n=1 Tax=Kitasatospora sp. NPDC056446 TaxID=3345819 RepID=UPI00369867BA